MIPFELRDARLAILGLGLMGGSLALALRPLCAELAVYDPDPEVRALAERLNLAERVESSLERVTAGANVVILAAPVVAILELIRQLPDLLQGEAVVLDIGSTKAEVCRAFADLPTRFDPLGGHPMTGKSVSGLAHADPRLFVGSVFAFTPLQRTGAAARQLAEDLARAIGAQPFVLDPDTHDQFVAATSHVPYLLSLALALATPEIAQPLVGPGFRSTARLAGSSVKMMSDILLTNRENILHRLKELIGILDEFEQALASEEFALLMTKMRAGQEKYQDLIDIYTTDGVHRPWI